MPLMGGMEATRLIRISEQERGGFEHIPIVGVTAHAMLGDREKCLDSGMNDYVVRVVPHRRWVARGRAQEGAMPPLASGSSRPFEISSHVH